MYRITAILFLSLLFPFPSFAQIFTLHPPNTTKLVSTDIKIDCTVLTSDLTIRWMKDGTVLSPTSSAYEITQNITESGLTSIFHIYTGEFPNTGAYICLAYRGATLEEQSYPGALLIHGQVQYLEFPLDQYVYLNQPIVLTCRVQGGPLPTLQWTRDATEGNVNVIADGIISISTVEDSSYEISSRLIFTHAQSSHNGTYHCETGNSFGIADRIARLSVNSEAIQPVSITQPTDGTTHTLIVSSPDPLSQVCTASGLPVPSLQWIFPASAKNAQVQINPTLTLYISNPAVEDAGTYTCMANNSLSSDAVSIQVNVVERPVVSASSDTTVIAASPITLSCAATGSPTPTVTLAHPNATLLPLDQNGRVVLFTTSYRDAGVYRCVATVLSISEQATFTLTVLSGPAFITTPSDTSVGVGRDATLRCVVFGNPTPIIAWYFNTSTTIFAPIPSTLIIPNVHSSDIGEYTCAATNEHGAISASAILYIVAIPVFLTTPDSTLASIGEIVRFPCAATTSTVTLEWYVDGLKISNIGFKYFVSTDGSLTISNLELSDSNTYTCRISNPAGSLDASAVLTVIERPTFIQEPLDQTVPEGEDVGFICEVSGTPLPSLSWLDGSDDTIETGGKFTVSMPTPSVITLNITAVTLSNAGEYTCLAQNGLDVMSSARLSITNPPQVTIEPSTQNAILGLQFILTCIVTYSVPPPSFQWYKNSARITTDSRVKSFTNGSLIISTVLLTDGGLYRCVAINNIGSDTAIGNVVIVIRPTFAPTPSSHTVPLGGDITIPCNAEGVPPPVTSWLLPDNTVAPNSGRFSWVSQVNGALTISNAETSDHGTFTCIATNAAGVIRMGIQLTVQVQPNAPTGASAVVVSESSVRVRWLVPFNGYSVITGYLIQKQIQGEELEDANLIWEDSGKSQGNQDSALVTNLIPFEHHQFRVAAANVIGVGAYSMQTNLVQLPSSSPPSPQNATTRALNSTAIHLAWIPPTYPYGVPNSYEVAWGVRGEPPLIISLPLSQSLQHTFTGLSIYTEYTFSIRAVNTNPSGGVFVGNFSDPVYQLTREEPPIGPPLNVTLQPVPGGILVGWNAPSPGLRQGLITGYNVFYRESLMNLLFPTLPPLALNQTNRTNESLLLYRNELAEYYQFGNMSFQMFLSPTPSDRHSHAQNLGHLKSNVYYDVKLQAINSAGIGPNSTAQTAKAGFQLDLVRIIVPSVLVPIAVCCGIIFCFSIVLLHQYYLKWKVSASNRKTYRDSGSAGSRRPLVASSSLQASNFEENRGFDDLTRKSKPSTAKRDSPSGKEESYLAAINEINRQIMESVGESDQEVTASGSESSDDESGSGSLSGINTDVFRIETDKQAEDTAGDTSIYNYDSIMPKVGEERIGSFATTKQTDFDDDKVGDRVREAPVLLSQDYSDDDDDDDDEERLSENEPPGDFYPNENSDLSEDDRLTYTDYMKSIQVGEQPQPKPDSQVSMGEYSHISDVSRQAKRQQAQIRLDEKQVKEEKKRLEQEKKLREKIATRERKAREKRAKVERKEREKEAKQRLKERQQSFYNPNVLDPDLKYRGMAMRDGNKNKDVLF